MTVAQLAQESQDRRRITWLLVVLLILIGLASWWSIPRIERSRTTATEARLAEQGWSDVKVAFSGRDAQLTGSAPPGVDPAEIMGFVDGIWGVRRVSSDIAEGGAALGGEAPAETLTPARVFISVSAPEDDPSGQAILLSGTLPSSVVVEAAVAEAGEAFGQSKVTNRLEVGPVEDAAWLTRIWQALAVLVDAGQVDVNIGGSEAVLSGTVVDDAAIANIEAAFGAVVAPELRVVNELSVSAVVDPLVVISVSDERVLLAGRAPQDAIDIAVTRAADAFGSSMVTNDMFAGNVSDARWLAPLWRMMPLFTRAGSLEITVDGAVARLEGEVPSLELIDEIANDMNSLAAVAGMAVINNLRFDAAAAAAACPAEDLNALLDEAVLFGSASDDLADEGRSDLDAVAALLLACEGVPVEVAGHTDSNGSASFNLDLSERRAQAVVDYLIEQGMDEDRLAAVGYGETQPIADNSTAEGRAQNRRIEFVVGGSP